MSLVDLGHVCRWILLSLVVVGRVMWCILFKTMLCYISKMLWLKVITFPPFQLFAVPAYSTFSRFLLSLHMGYSWTVSKNIIWHLWNTPHKTAEMESVLKMCERFGPFIKEAHFVFHVCTPWSAFLLHLFFLFCFFLIYFWDLAFQKM